MTSVKQSISWWCFENSDLTPERLVRVAADIGYAAFELVGPEHWPLIRDHGLAIAAVTGHQSISLGLNRQDQHDRIEREILANLNLAGQWGIANLIVFSGNRDGLDDAAGARITAEGLRRVAGAAEDAGVTLVLELLNSKVDHPDYQADRTAWGIEVCRMVDSPRVKLLYDIYHMQVMEGDIIRTIQTHAPFLGHYHTAGNPGRHEIGDMQELYYPAIMCAILASGYGGYVGQEFVPAGDPVAALKQAFEVCNVRA
jgi:hydroxypyruvate isomerase